jgi:hypothetical protein
MAFMAKKKPEPAPEKRERAGANLNVWIREDLYAALREYIAQTAPRTTKTAVVELCIEKHLREVGFWPPKPQSS